MFTKQVCIYSYNILWFAYSTYQGPMGPSGLQGSPGHKGEKGEGAAHIDILKVNF